MESLLPSGQIVTIAGGPGSTTANGGDTDGVGTNARFNTISHICIDFAGNMYTADQSNWKIKKITPEGVVSTFISGQNNPVCVAISPDGRTLYWANWSSYSIHKCNVLTPGTIITLATLDTNAFQPVNSIAVSADNTMLYMTSPNHNRILALSTNANNLTNFTASGVTPALVWCAGGTAGNVNGAGSAARFTTPNSITLGPNGNLYITDFGNNQIRMMTPLGALPTQVNVTTFAGAAAGYLDGQISNALFNGPNSLRFDKNENLYVGDSGNNRIRMITPHGGVSTIAGNSGSPSSTDGPIGTASLVNPNGLAIDSTGNLIFVERPTTNNSYYSHRIRKIILASPPSGVDMSELKLIKNGAIAPVDEAYGTGGVVYVSANDKLLMTYDNGIYKYYVNGIMVGKAVPSPPPNPASFYPIVAMQNQSGVSSLTSGLREIGFTNLITGQYNASVGFEALPLLLGGNQNIQLKSMKTKPASFKITKSTNPTNISLKHVPGKKISFRVKKQQRKSTMKRR